VKILLLNAFGRSNQILNSEARNITKQTKWHVMISYENCTKSKANQKYRY
jgi:hypothetical protein